MNDEANPPHCSAILVAAGSGTRMGFDKLLARLGGLSVLQRSLDVLFQSPSIHSIVIVCPTERWETLRIPADSGKPVIRADGGTLRQDSVLSGIRACPDTTTHVAIHDAARPLVHTEDIARVVTAAGETGAATLAHRVVETLKRSDSSQNVVDSVSRDHLWAMETPQVFALQPLLAAFSTTSTGEFTDEVSRMQAAGHRVRLVESLHPNPKITAPADLPLAEALLSQIPSRPDR